MKPQGFQRFMAELYIKRALLTIQFVLVQTKVQPYVIQYYMVQHTQLHMSVYTHGKFGQVNLRTSVVGPFRSCLYRFRDRL